MKLFLCHASEDKVDFVRPLAIELKKYYEVWYDEYSLVAGQSLLREINKGLIACDYGIVVLSPAFFAKKWTEEELVGMFALETKEHKIIIPIWLNVTLADIVKHFPMIADRVAIQASEGLPAIIEKIKLATNVIGITAGFYDFDAVKHVYQTVDAKIATNVQNQKLLNSKEGATLIHDAVRELCHLLEGRIAILQENTNLSFKCTSQLGIQQQNFLAIDAPYDLLLHIRLNRFYNVSASDTDITVKVLRGRPGDYNDEKPITLISDVFKPRFALDKTVCWESRENDFTTDQFSNYLLNLLAQEINKQIDK